MSDDRGTEIIPKLYIGNMYTARNKFFMEEKNIGAVLNMTPDVPNFFSSPHSHIEYARCNVKDSQAREDSENMYKYFPFIVNFIHKNLVLDQKNVLVHCHAGIQRSASAVAAYLMKTLKCTPDTAVKFIVSKRKIAFKEGTAVNFRDSLWWYYSDEV